MEIGKTISHYKITEKLGEGGMGVVYKAEDTKLNQDMALKFLPQLLTSYEEDNQFIVMEYIEGKTLGAKIKAGDLAEKTALEYAANFSDALTKAH